MAWYFDRKKSGSSVNPATAIFVAGGFALAAFARSMSGVGYYVAVYGIG